MVRVLSGEEIALPPFNLISTSFYLFLNSIKSLLRRESRTMVWKPRFTDPGEIEISKRDSPLPKKNKDRAFSDPEEWPCNLPMARLWQLPSSPCTEPLEGGPRAAIADATPAMPERAEDADGSLGLPSQPV